MANTDRGTAILDAERTRRKATGSRFPRVWIDDAQASTDPTYCIKGLIDQQALSLIYGPSGDGKTFFTLDLSAHVAAGMRWRGLRVRQGLVVYVAAEAGASILRRFIAWRDRNVGEAREGRVPLAIITRSANLLEIVDVDTLLEELRAIAIEAKIPLALVVFDTLSRSMPGGDENKSADMTSVIAAADAIRDELEAGVVLVHHSGKDAQKGARGHSSLFAAADTVISVVERVAVVEKVRDGLTGGRFPFALDVVSLGEDSDGDPVTTCVVQHLDNTGPGRRPNRKLSGVAKVAFQALTEAVTDHGEVMPSSSTIPGGVRAVTMVRWRDQFRLRYGTDTDGGARDQDAIKKAFQRAREQLVEAVGVSDPYVWLTQ